MHGLSARAKFRGKRATKNIREFAFPGVLFDLLARTNRSFCVFNEVFFGLFPIVEGLGRPDSFTTELYDDVNA
jgi:hypothetical protein